MDFKEVRIGDEIEPSEKAAPAPLAPAPKPAESRADRARREYEERQALTNVAPTVSSSAPGEFKLDLEAITRETSDGDSGLRMGKRSRRKTVSSSSPLSLTVSEKEKQKAKALSGMSVGQLQKAVEGRPSELVRFAGDMAKALAQSPGAGVGMVAQSFQKGWLQGVVATEQELVEIRGVTAVKEEIARGAQVLARNSVALDLIEQMRAHGYLEGVNDPKEALKIAATLLHSSSAMMTKYARDQDNLVRIELDTLKYYLRERETVALSMGKQVAAPFVGAISEVIGGIPVEISRRLLVGMVEVLDETTTKAAQIPTNVFLALVLYPMEAALDRMRDMAADMSPEKAVGATVMAVPSALLALALGAEWILPQTSLLEKGLIWFGSDLFVLVPMGTAAYLLTAAARGEHHQTSRVKVSGGDDEQAIKGDFKVVKDK